MSFLNVWLLAGAAAMVAPLLIHLLNRSQFQSVSWGAMHLLDAALESNTRRVQWESWLLLLIRCLIPVLLAVTLARPALTHLQTTRTDPHASLTLLIDNSLSMADSEQGESLLERAASQLINIARQSDRAELELWSVASPIRNLTTEPAINLPQLAIALQGTGPAAGVSWPNETLQLCSRLASSSQTAGRQIILASDFQAALWNAVSENELQAVRNQLADTEFATQLFLLPLRKRGKPANLSVHWEDAPPTARLDQPYQAVVQVTNHGSQPVNNVDVTFQFGGRDLASRRLRLAAGASEQVPFACEFTELGWQSVAVRIVDANNVRGDDQCFHAVQVVAPARVLIIDDSLSSSDVKLLSTKLGRAGSFAGASRFLRLALAPFAEPQQNPFLLRHTRAEELSSDQLAEHAVVIVAQLDSLTASLAEKMATYVASGGGLLLFAPSTTHATVESSPTEITKSWLPLRLGQLRTAAESQPAKLVTDNTQLDSGGGLGQALASGAEVFEFTRWWELIPSGDILPVQVIAKLNSGDPWLAERTMGAGVVLPCASSCAGDGTNLPNQPAYVPLMLSLTERLAAHASRAASLTTGQLAAFQVMTTAPQQPSATVSQSTPGDALSVRRIVSASRDEESSMVSATAWELPLRQGRAEFAETRQPGIYQARMLAAQAMQASVEPGFISINTPKVESHPLALSRTELHSLAKRLGATVIESSDDYVRSEKVRREGWEFWRWLLLAVLGLLFIELFIGLRGTSAGATVN